MKRFVLMAFVAASLFSCQKEATQDSRTEASESALNLTINVNKSQTRAVEDGHDGVNGDKVSPKIFSVTVISYNDAGTELTATDLTQDQIDQAIYGSYRNPDASTGANTNKGSGAIVGLPKGTVSVDVVVNRAPLSKYSEEANINYVNYRDNLDDNGKPYTYGSDNFDRVILTTSAYGKGTPLDGNLDPTIETPTYKLDFTVKPYMTRMEVYGAINVAEEQVWIDGYANKWRAMAVADYELLDPANVSDAQGHYPKGAVKGTVDNGFDINTVYIPEYYWYRASGSTADPVVRTPANSHETEAEVNDPLTDNAGWVRQPFYNTQAHAVQVKWFPNRFYAVDVESVFVNNIKVRDAGRDPYQHPWPGSQTDAGWPDWYKAFHIGGWHKSGSSDGNTFLCMGNMWDRIATSDKVKAITIPTINNISTMDILIGKAKPITKVSAYYATDRNLGIAPGRATGYAIYPQMKKPSTSDQDALDLRNEMPHVIVKVKVYKSAADYAAGKYQTGKEFITITLFSDAAAGASNGKYITDFQGGNIYRMNLNDLLYQFIGDVPVPEGKPTEGDPKDPTDPDPEMPDSQLVMTVSILPWTIQNIFPNI